MVFGDWIGEPSRLLALPLRLLASALDLLVDTSTKPARPAAQPHPRSRSSSTAAFERDIAPDTARAVHATPPDDPPAQRAPSSRPLAEARSSDQLIVLPRTPESAFAFWNVTADSVERARAELRDPTCALALRLRERSEPAGSPREQRVVPVAPGASGLYLTDLPENETLEVSLGVASSGGFVEITASSILR